MNVLRITTPNIPIGATMISTSWIMAEDGDWENPFFSSPDDTENLLSIQVNKVLDPSKTYRAMARVLHSDGVTLWSDVDELEVIENKSIDGSMYTPSIINRPILTTIFDVNNHPINGFLIELSEYQASGDSTAKDTTWVIEDKKGNTVFLLPNSTEHTDSLLVKDVLADNEVYTIRASRRGSNNDISELGAITIHTNTDNNLVLLNNINSVRPETDLPLIIQEVPDMTRVEWILSNNGKTVWSGVSTSVTTIVPKDVINSNTDYVLIGRLVVNGEDRPFRYFYFRTLTSEPIYLDGPLPFTIGYQGSVV